MWCSFTNECVRDFEATTVERFGQFILNLSILMNFVFGSSILILTGTVWTAAQTSPVVVWISYIYTYITLPGCLIGCVLFLWYYFYLKKIPTNTTWWSESRVYHWRHVWSRILIWSSIFYITVLLVIVVGSFLSPQR